MFEFLGNPFLGETRGINALRSSPSSLDYYFDWIDYDLPPESEHNAVLLNLRMAIVKASHIYLGRTASNRDQWELLESLKQLVGRIGPDQPGSHALVWVCFICAADSTDPEHRQFFVDRMEQIFHQTKFNNITAALDSLPRIWRQTEAGSWTKNLALTAPALVM
jgi:hypothetical protein